MKIIIKLPIKDGKFKLQSRNKIEPRQYRSASGLLAGLDRLLERKLSRTLGVEFVEKLAIEIKEYNHSSFENVNESLSSTDREYLIYATSCFLEDYLSQETLNKYARRWEVSRR